MFLRLTIICFVLCAFGQVNSTPTFGLTESGSGSSGSSIIGDLLRRKAQFLDNVKGHFFPGPRTGTTASPIAAPPAVPTTVPTVGQPIGQQNGQLNGQLNSQLNTQLNGQINGRLNGQLISAIPRPSIISATITPSATESSIVVPTTPGDLIATVLQRGYLDPATAQSLTYVQGQPELLFQYVNELGQIIPITGDLAVQLVPNIQN